MNVLILGAGAREHALALAVAKSPSAGQALCRAGQSRLRRRRRKRRAGHTRSPRGRRLLSIARSSSRRRRTRGAAGRRRRRRSRGGGDPLFRAQQGGGAARRLERLHQGFLPRVRRADRRLSPLSRRGAPRSPMFARTARRLSSRRTAWRRERASSSRCRLGEAESAIVSMFAGAFGAAGAEVVVEDYLPGEEISFFALSDGTRATPFASAQDHKRVGDGDTGPNTGGMGAYSPPPIMTPALSERVMREIVTPTVAGMAKRGAPFRGVLFAGLMIGRGRPQADRIQRPLRRPRSRGDPGSAATTICSNSCSAAPRAPCRTARRSSPTRPR